MASVDIVQLSSPPRQFITYNRSSSPILPSPRDICRGVLNNTKNGNFAVPASTTLKAPFTTAAAVLKSASRAENSIWTAGKSVSGLCVSSEVEAARNTLKKTTSAVAGPKITKVRKTSADSNAGSAPPTVSKDTALRKPRTKKLVAEDTEDATAKLKPARKSRAKKADIEFDNKGKEKSARKPRMIKGEDGVQSKIPKGQVKKFSMSEELDKATGFPKSKHADKVSKHFPPAGVKPSSDTTDHGLIEAVRRRMNWTPPPMTANEMSSITLPTINPSDNDVSSRSSTSDCHSKGFTDLFGSFGFQSNTHSAIEKKLPVETGTRKRKLIELVDNNFPTSIPVSVLKKKAPARKATTITALATSAFVDPTDSPNQSAPLLQYFSCESTVTATSNRSKESQKRRSARPIKSSAKAKQGTAQAPILLSPDTALKQTLNQDFVFGTSSQLAREDSPTLLRALHEAMQASNKMDIRSSAALSTEGAPSDGLSRAPRERSPLNAHKLWSAAFRDTNGKLLDIEVVDLADSPAPIVKVSKLVVNNSASSAKDHQPDDVWLDVDGSDNEAPFTEESEPSDGVKAAETMPKTAAVPSILGSHLDVPETGQALAKGISLDPDPKCKAITKPVMRSQKPKPTTQQAKPDYASYTNAQLAKDIASYHFKPVKTRNQMIALLERCWEGQQRTALAALGTNKILETSSMPSDEHPDEATTLNLASSATPKRPRGRPRKDGSLPGSPREVTSPDLGSTIVNIAIRGTNSAPKTRTPKKTQPKARLAVEEISDSDAPSTPSPPRRRPSQIRGCAIPLQLSPTSGDDSPGLTPKSAQATVFAHITQAVLNQPPTKDISKPSWYEKILLYDPIVLEDLTVWLNTGALEKAGWDGEIEPKEVKRWCESKSICCLWRENLRGGSRTRY